MLTLRMERFLPAKPSLVDLTLSATWGPGLNIAPLKALHNALAASRVGMALGRSGRTFQ